VNIQNEDNLIAHCDLYAWSKVKIWNKTKTEFKQDLQDLINNYDIIIVVTLKVSKAILCERINLRLSAVKRRKDLYKKFRRLLHLWKKRKEFMDGKCDTVYESWFDYINIINVENHWLLDASEANDMKLYLYKKN